MESWGITYGRLKLERMTIFQAMSEFFDILGNAAETLINMIQDLLLLSAVTATISSVEREELNPYWYCLRLHLLR